MMICLPRWTIVATTSGEDRETLRKRETHPLSRAIGALSLVLTASLWGCGKSTLDYHYDVQTETCRNMRGQTGYNEGQVVECGHISRTTLNGNNFQNQNL